MHGYGGGDLLSSGASSGHLGRGDLDHCRIRASEGHTRAEELDA